MHYYSTIEVSDHIAAKKVQNDFPVTIYDHTVSVNFQKKRSLILY